MSAFNIELDTVKAFLGYPVGSPNDNARDMLVQMWLDMALDMAQRITGRQLLKATYRDTFDYQHRTVYLNEAPVLTVLSVSVGTTPLVVDNDFQVFTTTGRVEFAHHRHHLWQLPRLPGFQQHLIIDYVGGYDTLPASLLMAVLMGIQAADQAHKQMNNFGGTIKQVSVIDVGTTAFAVRQNFTSAAMQTVMEEHLSDYYFGTNSYLLGTYLLHETERIGDAPGSPG